MELQEEVAKLKSTLTDIESLFYELRVAGEEVSVRQGNPEFLQIFSAAETKLRRFLALTDSQLKQTATTKAPAGISPSTTQSEHSSPQRVSDVNELSLYTTDVSTLPSPPTSLNFGTQNLDSFAGNLLRHSPTGSDDLSHAASSILPAQPFSQTMGVDNMSMNNVRTQIDLISTGTQAPEPPWVPDPINTQLQHILRPNRFRNGNIQEGVISTVDIPDNFMTDVFLNPVPLDKPVESAPLTDLSFLRDTIPTFPELANLDPLPNLNAAPNQMIPSIQPEIPRPPSPNPIPLIYRYKIDINSVEKSELRRTALQILDGTIKSTIKIENHDSIAESLFKSCILHLLQAFAFNNDAALQRIFKFRPINEIYTISRIITALRVGLQYSTVQWPGRLDDDTQFPGYCGPTGVERIYLEAEASGARLDRDRFLGLVCHNAYSIGNLPRVSYNDIQSAIVLSTIF